MSFLIVDPEMIGAAADEMQGIGSALAVTNAAAAAPTTGVLPPATDSVSVRAAALLDAHAQMYQTLSAQAESFHDKFVQTLTAAQNAYAEAEASNAGQLASAGSPASPTSPSNVILFMGGTGDPTPSQQYMTAIEKAYLGASYSGYTQVSLHTPEQFWPITSLTDESFGSSVRQGVAILNQAVMTQIAEGHHVVVVGYSQSATIATLEMRYLDALPAAVRPSSQLLSFVMLGDPNNAFGGILTHFIPGFGAFHVMTPFNTPYMTAIYSIQYDPIADFPINPLWLPSDLNALAGLFELHSNYPLLTAAQVATAVHEQFGNVGYYLLPTANLPLLDPLRNLPLLGNPMANMLQPFLEPIVDLGYGPPLPGLSPFLDPLAAALGPVATPGIAAPLAAAPPLGFSVLPNAV